MKKFAKALIANTIAVTLFCIMLFLFIRDLNVSGGRVEFDIGVLITAVLALANAITVFKKTTRELD